MRMVDHVKCCRKDQDDEFCYVFSCPQSSVAAMKSVSVL